MSIPSRIAIWTILWAFLARSALGNNINEEGPWCFEQLDCVMLFPISI